MTFVSSPGWQIAQRIVDNLRGQPRGSWFSMGPGERQEISWQIERTINDALQNGTVQILVGCQVEGCAESVSFHLDMVRMWKGAPMCEPCYTHDFCDGPECYIQWSELPRVTVLDLKE